MCFLNCCLSIAPLYVYEQLTKLHKIQLFQKQWPPYKNVSFLLFFFLAALRFELELMREFSQTDFVSLRKEQAIVDLSWTSVNMYVFS
jgi:hypothetical protein